MVVNFGMLNPITHGLYERHQLMGGGGVLKTQVIIKIIGPQKTCFMGLKGSLDSFRKSAYKLNITVRF